MADFVTIANIAAEILGEEDRLRTPDQGGKFARNVRAVWDVARQSALRGHKFNFSIKRRSLAARPLASGEIIYPWAYAFPVGDLLRLVEILSPALSKADYEREGNDILANTAGPLIVRGVVDIIETSEWDALFVPAHAAKVAWYIADTITGDRARRADADAAFVAATREAKKVDALENPPIAFEDSSWIEARYWG